MTILRGDIDPTDTKKVDGIVSKLLGTQAKYLGETRVLGKKKLAYMINKQTDGVYHLAHLEAPAIKADELNKQVKLMPEIVRFMLVAV